MIRHYVISGGADLDRYLGKWVEVTGNEIRPDSLRGDPVVVVERVLQAWQGPVRQVDPAVRAAPE